MQELSLTCKTQGKTWTGTQDGTQPERKATNNHTEGPGQTGRNNYINISMKGVYPAFFLSKRNTHCLNTEAGRTVTEWRNELVQWCCCLTARSFWVWIMGLSVWNWHVLPVYNSYSGFSSGYSAFPPQCKYMQVRLIGGSKLPLGMSECCVCSVMDWQPAQHGFLPPSQCMLG